MVSNSKKQSSLQAFVCPTPWSDMPWAVVTPSSCPRARSRQQHPKPQDYHNPPPFDIFRLRLVNYFLLKKRKALEFNGAT